MTSSSPDGPWGLSACCVRFGTTHGTVAALEEISLAVPRGQVTAVVGGDGAGKTTLLRTLAGRIVPAAGEVRVPPPRRIGFLPSASGVWNDLTVDENVEFVGRAYALGRSRLAARRLALLGRAELLGAAGRLAGRLSGGMRRKLGFCLALLHEPDLVILDEPTTGVDPVSRVELWRMIAETASSGSAVVLSTTYLDEAERAASVLVLDDGHTLYSGEPQSIAAAVPGTIVHTPVRPPGGAGESAWRRGREFRAWYADATAGEVLDEPDLEDAVIALTLARSSEGDAGRRDRAGEAAR